ncbi:DUF4144 family protein [Psychromonas sp. SA13A]|uniref:DUF4144 family protein n=1 Tax=Psychromonas sp. SA13A TaxID=2686346 RepID=UPI0014091BD0|nr:DUF4144 family protein [Psychromonas sp. SA13A]
MICWPCLLKLEGEHELIYLADESEFIAECEELIVSDDDYVVDSNGLSYLLKFSNKTNNSRVQLVDAERQLSKQEVTLLIREHEFSKANVCLTKIEFLTISCAVLCSL